MDIIEKRRKNADRERIRRQNNGAKSLSDKLAVTAGKADLVNRLFHLDEKSVPQIVAEAGISRAQVYRYIIPSEPISEVFLRMVDRWTEQGYVTGCTREEME